MATNFITLFSALMTALNAITNAIKAFWKAPENISIRNLGVKEQLNLLEISNVGGKDIKNLRVLFPNDQNLASACYWDGFDLGKPLSIEYLRAGDHIVYPFMYGFVGKGGYITFEVIWGDKQNKQRSINVHLYSVDGCK